MSKTKAGMRAITMQQPFASAMVHAQGLFTRRGKPAKFAEGNEGGEWIAVHCGGNSEHLKNKALMEAVREKWPGCPSNEDLTKQQVCVNSPCASSFSHSTLPLCFGCRNQF